MGEAQTIAKKFAVVNTLLNTTDITLVNQLSGRQGDNGRTVYFAMRDGELPHDLSNQTVSITAKDAQGKVKIITGIKDMISQTGGMFSMIIPGEMYQAAGDVEEAFMSVKDDTGVVISTIPISFRVLENNIILSANASKDYIDAVDKLIEEINGRISGLLLDIQAQKAAYEALKIALQELLDQIKNNQPAMLHKSNLYTEENVFEKTVTVKQGINGSLNMINAKFTDLLTVSNAMDQYPGWWTFFSPDMKNSPDNDGVARLFVLPNVLSSGKSPNNGIMLYSNYRSFQMGFVSNGEITWTRLDNNDSTLIKTSGGKIDGDLKVGGSVIEDSHIYSIKPPYSDSTAGFQFYRRGNKVYFTAGFSISTDKPAGFVTAEEVLPLGWRPVIAARPGFDSTNGEAHGVIAIGGSGMIQVLGTAIKAGTSIYSNGFWYTNDPMPTSSKSVGRVTGQLPLDNGTGLTDNDLLETDINNDLLKIPKETINDDLLEVEKPEEDLADE